MVKNIYLDMDGVLCAFHSAYLRDKELNPSLQYPQSRVGFFVELDEIDGAIETFNILKEDYDMWILTRPSFMNIHCYSEKAQWILDKLGFDIQEKTILCGDKSLLKGDYLIDDCGGSGQEDFEGEWIQFGSDNFPNWKSVLKYLKNE